MATQTPLEETLPKRITAGLLRVGTALRSHAWEGAALAGLTPTQGEILTLLLSRSVPMRLGEIAADAALTSATVSEAVSTLETKGLVEKRRDANDGRALALRLTARGKTAAKRASQWPDFLTVASDALGDKERVQLYRTMVKLIYSMQGRGDVPPQRMCLSCAHFEPASGTRGAAAQHHCNYYKINYDDSGLRLDCAGHEEADMATQRKVWKIFNKS
ncbi:MarR family transcriptional regulator [Pandoraea terrae]|uniref:MarR family transcriptional regulator n=1 Tax=Pandoraea terrae TaxID=1537710 RepID=A0A5E4VYG6_9BURK|nr:MarR family winged helix-turn-helix transcriptional regulator [Pandoraea terrae]VVE17667.1 MarR family transcriptional regulator [Pandoraea terrae]